MEELKQSFPADLDYSVSLDTTLAVSEGINEIVHTLGRGDRARDPGGVHLPAGLARHADPAARRAGVAGRHVRGASRCSASSINTLSLFGLVLAIGLVVDDAIVVVEAVEHHIEHGLSPRDATLKAMSEVSGPVIAIALILVRGVRADRVHPRHHGPALPAVRGHDRRLGDLLGVQRAHALARALGAAAAPAQGVARPARRVLQLVQPRVRPGHRGLRPLVSPADRASRRARCCCWSAWPCSRGSSARACPAASCPRRTRATSTWRCSSRTPPRCSAPTRSASQVERDPRQDAGRAELQHGRRLQPALAGLRHLQRLLLRDLQGLGRAQGARGAVRRDQGAHQPRAREAARGDRVRVPAARDPGRRHRGRRHVHARGPRGPRASSSSPRTPSASWTRRASGPRSRWSRRTFAAVRAAGLRRRGPRQGAEAGRRARATSTRRCRRSWAAAFINYFNRFGRTWQVYVQAEGEFRTRAENIGQFYVLNAKGESVPLSTLVDDGAESGPEFTMRFNQYRSAQINVTAKPGYSSAQVMRALEQVFASTMPSRDGLRLQRHVVPGEGGAAGRVADGDLRPLAARRVPDPRRAVRELVAAVQRAARHADRGVRARSSRCSRAASRTTSSRRSAWSC